MPRLPAPGPTGAAAPRVEETGLGIRLPPYSFAAGELLGGIDRLLGDDALHARLQAMAARIQAADGRTLAADLIERSERRS